MQPAPGVVEIIGGVEELRVYNLVERLDSGVHVYLQLWFRADRPPRMKSLRRSLMAALVYWASRNPIPGGTSYENAKLGRALPQRSRMTIFGDANCNSGSDGAERISSTKQ